MSSSSRFSDGRLGAPPPGPVWVPQGLTPGVRTLNEPTISLQRVHTPDPVADPAAAPAPTSMRPEPKVPAVVKLASKEPASAGDLPVAAPPAKRVPEVATRLSAQAVPTLAETTTGADHNHATVANAASEPDRRAWVEPEWAAPAAVEAAPAAPEPWQAPVAAEAPAIAAAAASQSASNTNLVADVRRRLQAAPPPAATRPSEMRPVARFRALLSRSAVPAQHTDAAAEYEPVSGAERWPEPGAPYAVGYADATALPADEAWPAPAPEQQWNTQRAHDQQWHAAEPQAHQHAPHAEYAQSWPGAETGYADARGTAAGSFPYDTATEGWTEANASAPYVANGASVQYQSPTLTGRLAQGLTARGGALPWVAGCVVLAAISAVGLGVWLSGKSDVPVQRTVVVVPAPAVRAAPAPLALPAAVAPVTTVSKPNVTPELAAVPAPAASAIVLPDRPFEAVVTCPGMAAGKPITVLGPDPETVRAGLAQSLPNCTLDRLTAMGPAPASSAVSPDRASAETMP